MKRLVGLLALVSFLSLPLLAEGPSTNPADGKLVASYAVANGKFVPLKGGPEASARDQKRHQAIWLYVQNVVPEKFKPLVTRFDVFQGDSSSDEESDAYVSLNDDDDGTWLFAVNINYADSIITKAKAELEDFNKTIIHEIGHLVSEEASQMLGPDEKAGKDALVLDDGTARPDSWIAQFYRKFWAGRYKGNDGLPKEDESSDDAQALFDGHPSDFVTDYSATNVLEDFSETFAAFVAGPAASSGLAAQKIKFFEASPEFGKYRDSIRKSLR
jgi:hypothetical protein